MTAREYPRQFVSETDSLGSWEQIEKYLDDLQSRDIEADDSFERWLRDWSELVACIDEVASDRYVKMTCQTDDADRKRDYLDFVENIEPKCKPRWHDIHKKYVAAGASDRLSSDRYAVLDRSIRNQVSLFREENVELEVTEAQLVQQYQEINGAMTVRYDGEEKTLQQLAVYMESTDRGVRQEVWEISNKRRLEDADKLDDLFDQLIQLRHKMAVNADLPDFRALAFKRRERFDYTSDDCIAFHDSMESACVPLLRRLREQRQDALGVDPLRPWDLAVDPAGREPLRPFANTDELVGKCKTLFDRVDPELAGLFREMSRRRELDLDSRKGKAPGGYQTTFHETRRPFIFMNAVGVQRDVRTLIHESGHAFHALACRNEPIVHYRSAPIEFCEVASMGMEMLAYPHFDVFFEGEDLDRAKRNQIESVITLLPWVATIDAFQHWIYTNPEHTRNERRDCWLSLNRRFGGHEDYTGYESALERQWHRQLHLFEVPFYYIEYAIAQLGALGVWQNAEKDRDQALAAYRRALAIGGSKPLPQLFEAAGLKFDFSINTIKPLLDALGEELERLAV
jgi:oligoendopeptidase F